MTKEEQLNWLRRLRSDISYMDFSIDVEVSLERKKQYRQVLSEVINALERKKGKWIEYIPEHGKCPFCGNQVDLLGGKINNFCGECGADMRGVANERNDQRL